MDDKDSQGTCSSLLGEVSRVISDVLLRQLLFAASVVTPDYWNIITKFGVNKSSEFKGAVLLPEQARLAVENIAFVDC